VANRSAPARPRWANLVLSATFTLALLAAFLLSLYVLNETAGFDLEGAFFASLLGLIAIYAALFVRAYPADQRRWWRWLIWGGLTVFWFVIPAIWLPWRIVTRSRSSA
jgi:hypothetical protein